VHPIRRGWRLYNYPALLAFSAINLGGVAQSLQQAWSGVKTPFNRTPKISGRTTTPATYHGAQYGILLYCSQAGVLETINGFYSHAVYSIVNAIFLLYGIGRFIGFDATREDLRSQCYFHAVFSIMNANFLFYGIGEFVGFPLRQWGN
jgi:cellulose synthase (UDP-forming)